MSRVQRASLPSLPLSAVISDVVFPNFRRVAALAVNHSCFHQRAMLLVTALVHAVALAAVIVLCHCSSLAVSRRQHFLLGESLTEPDARSWMFFDWDKVNRTGVVFRLLSILLEDLPQLVIQATAAAKSNEAMSTVAIASIVLTAMCVASTSRVCAREAQL